MYCKAVINHLECVTNELLLWTDISSEHPIFIKTVAELTNKKLSEEITARLNGFNVIFNSLNKKASLIQKKLGLETNIIFNPIEDLREIIDDFIQADIQVINFIPQIQKYGKEDAVWQELLHHILHEQKFMLELFNNIKMQLIMQ